MALHEVTHAMTGAGQAGTRERYGLRGLLAPYAEIVHVRGAWRFSAAAFIGRMPMAMYGLGAVLLIAEVTGRFALAGSVSAAGSLGAAACSPRVARLADTHGQRRVLLPLVAGFAASVAGLVAAVQLDASDWALFLAGIAGGATMPALGPMVRARWSALLSDSQRLHTAFSLESAADELCFMVGPAIVTVLAAELHPAAGVAVAVLSCLAGSLWFASQRDTEPARSARRRGHRGRRPPGRKTALAPLPILAVLIAVYLCLGAMFVAIDMSTVDFAIDAGHEAFGGLVLACYALGGAAGGLWYGSRTWKAPAARRLALALGLSAAGVSTFWAMPGLLTLTVVIFLSGLAAAPALIAGFSVLESQTLPGRTTEAMSWLSTGLSIGVACGAIAAGFTLSGFGPRWGYVLAACCAVASALVCVGGLRRLAAARAW